MRSISKAMIAVMIAAAMCVVPLFVIEDADAADFETIAKGASFKAGSIDDDKFNGFVSEDYKKMLCLYALSAMGVSRTEETHFLEWEFSDITIKNVKDVKISKANEVTSTSSTEAEASAISYEIAFKAKNLLTSVQLFPTVDGTQALYKALGDKNILPANTVIEVNGTVSQDESIISESNFGIVDSGKYVMKSTVKKTYGSTSFDGYFILSEKKVTYENSQKMSYELKSSAEYDDKFAEVTSLTKAFVITTLEQAGATQKLNYKVGDDSGSYGIDYDKNAMQTIVAMMIIPETFGYERGSAGDLGLVFDIEDVAATIVSYVLYDSTDADKALFVDAMLATAYQNNDACVKFLNDNGTTGTEYSDAKSVADSAYSTVSVGGSGGNNIIFYVIIGVLAVAVVALAVLMIKKK